MDQSAAKDAYDDDDDDLVYDKSMSREKREAAYAKTILARAEGIVQDVHNAYIVQQRGHAFRRVPQYRPEEISLGEFLGKGGFGQVHEIRKFTLDDKDDQDRDPASSGATSLANSRHDFGDPLMVQGSSNNSSEHRTSVQVVVQDDPSSQNEVFLPVKGNNGVQFDTSSQKDTGSIRTCGSFTHVHYDYYKARILMEKRCIRNGTSRYAIKRLRGDLTELERARGMVDLALEAKFLSVVWHPNIIKLRGMASGNMVDRDFFIILDRLHETLDRRMNTWHKKYKKMKRGCCGIPGEFGQDRFGLAQLMIERMTVAYDIAAAMFYLHENRLVYRDIKPENIGFDLRGDVKVFDFGLCKSLSSKLKASNHKGSTSNVIDWRTTYGYKLTGRAGSLPYMAPEVVMMRSYDTKCDVFSFAILLWEMLSLRKAFDGMSATEFVERVVLEKERLSVPRLQKNDKKGLFSWMAGSRANKGGATSQGISADWWPPLTKLMLPEAWDDDPRNRPDMKRVAILIRGDLNDLTTDESVIHRTNHMDSRSNHSIELEQIEMEQQHDALLQQQLEQTSQPRQQQQDQQQGHDDCDPAIRSKETATTPSVLSELTTVAAKTKRD